MRPENGCFWLAAGLGLVAVALKLTFIAGVFYLLYLGIKALGGF